MTKGEKVLATSTRTGKKQAELVAAILVHHDTNLYDLSEVPHPAVVVAGA